MIGSIIGGALNIGASIFGGIKQAKAMKKVQKNLQNQMAENQNWYDRRYNEDATQRADAQRLITMTEESIKNRNKQAAGSAAVMGGTEESVAAAKAANNGALADTMSQIAVNAEQRKDAIEDNIWSARLALTSNSTIWRLKRHRIYRKQCKVSQVLQVILQAISKTLILYGTRHER